MAMDNVGQVGLEPILRLINGELSGSGAASAETPEQELCAWGPEVWAQILRQLPIDAYTFLGELEHPWETVTAQLDRWCRGFRERPEPYRERYRSLFGHLGLLLITLVSLRHSCLYRVHDPATGADTTHDCADLCEPMLAEPAVQEALRVLYAPDPAEDTAATQEEWNRIDFSSLRFHRHGTTSFILVGDSVSLVQGRRRPLALKCILFPFLRVSTIVGATRDYLSRYAAPGTDLRHLAHVWASSGRWILMDFVPGQTLEEYLRGQPAGDGLQVDLLAELGPQLFAAMTDLEGAGLQHGDLSPSNIIVRRDAQGERTLVLVDLGVNYLYLHAAPGSGGPDAAFIAPEVRTRGQNVERADIYSVGQLLIAVAGAPGGWPDRPSVVPDDFYAESPVLARFLEDLIDRDPARRLLIFQPDATQPFYPQLLAFFEEELAAVRATRADRTEGIRGLFTPLSGAPERARNMWRIRRSQMLYQNPRRGMHVRWLMFWSWLCAVAWYLSGTIVVYWWLRDFGWGWGNQPIAVLQYLTGSTDDKFPGLDALRDYPIKDFWGNLDLRITGMSFLIVGTRHYQNVLSGLTPLTTGWHQGRLSVLAFLAEVNMRLASVLAPLLTLPPTLVQRDWWPIFTAIGIFCVFLCNLFGSLYASAAVRRARVKGLTTVPSGQIRGIANYRSWAASVGFYSAFCWGIGLLLTEGRLYDRHVYASLAAAVNLVMFHIRNCSGSNAASVRTGLGRACLAAERLRYLPPAPRTSTRPAAEHPVMHPATANGT